MITAHPNPLLLAEISTVTLLRTSDSDTNFRSAYSATRLYFFSLFHRTQPSVSRNVYDTRKRTHEDVVQTVETGQCLEVHLVLVPRCSRLMRLHISSVGKAIPK